MIKFITSGYMQYSWRVINQKLNIQEILLWWKDGSSYIHILPNDVDVEKVIINRMHSAGIKA